MAARCVCCYVAVSLLVFPAAAAQLPSARPCGASREADGSCDVALHDSSEWWARVHDQVFFPPPASMLELSPDISDYYYAVGHPSALTDEIKAHRVGGAGLYHIFHLPDGPSSLQFSGHGERRSTFSALEPLKKGIVLSAFPEYQASSAYTNPLEQQAQELERESVEALTPELYKQTLKEVTSLGEGGVSTRSYQDAEASRAVTDYLQDKFLEFGLSSCLDRFSHEGKELANVIAMIPGQTRIGDALLMVAHYDSRPFTGAAPGAVDNGSGLTTMLLNAQRAAHMSKHGNWKPAKDVIFAAVGGEEPGLVGSANLVPRLQMGTSAYRNQLANGPAKKISDCRSASASFLERRTRRVGYNSAIVLDEVGWASPKRPKHMVNFETLDKASNNAIMEHLAHVNADYNGDKLAVEHSGKPFGSDHMSFLDNQEAAVLLINSDDDAYPYYHQSQDTIDQVNPEYGVEVARMALGGMMRTAAVAAAA